VSSPGPFVSVDRLCSQPQLKRSRYNGEKEKKVPICCTGIKCSLCEALTVDFGPFGFFLRVK